MARKSYTPEQVSSALDRALGVAAGARQQMAGSYEQGNLQRGLQNDLSFQTYQQHANRGLTPPAPKKPDDSSLLGDLWEGAMNVLGTPAAMVTSAFKEYGDWHHEFGKDQHASWSDWWHQVWDTHDRVSAGDILGATSRPLFDKNGNPLLNAKGEQIYGNPEKGITELTDPIAKAIAKSDHAKIPDWVPLLGGADWMKAGISVLGAVATDPLTYIGAPESLAKMGSIGKAVSHGVDARAAEAAAEAARVATEAGHTAEAVTAAAVAAAQKSREASIASKVLERVQQGGLHALSAEERAMYLPHGVRGGLVARMPFTSAEATILPESVTSVLTRPLGDARRAVANELFGPGGKLEGLRRSFTFGDQVSKDAKMALRYGGAKGYDAGTVQAVRDLAKTSMRKLDADMLSEFDKAIKSVPKDQMHLLIPALEGDEVARDLLAGAHKPMADLFEIIRKRMTERGLSVNGTADYFPHIMTDAARTALGHTSSAENFFEMGRTLTNPEHGARTWLGVTIDGTTVAERVKQAESALRKWVAEHPEDARGIEPSDIVSMFHNDPRYVFSAYSRIAARRMAHADAVRSLAMRGIGDVPQDLRDAAGAMEGAASAATGVRVADLAAASRGLPAPPKLMELEAPKPPRVGWDPIPMGPRNPGMMALEGPRPRPFDATGGAIHDIASMSSEERLAYAAETERRAAERAAAGLTPTEAAAEEPYRSRFAPESPVWQQIAEHHAQASLSDAERARATMSIPENPSAAFTSYQYYTGNAEAAKNLREALGAQADNVFGTAKRAQTIASEIDETVSRLADWEAGGTFDPSFVVKEPTTKRYADIAPPVGLTRKDYEILRSGTVDPEQYLEHLLMTETGRVQNGFLKRWQGTRGPIARTEPSVMWGTPDAPGWADLEEAIGGPGKISKRKMDTVQGLVDKHGPFRTPADVKAIYNKEVGAAVNKAIAGDRMYPQLSRAEKAAFRDSVKAAAAKKLGLTGKDLDLLQEGVRTVISTDESIVSILKKITQKNSHQKEILSTGWADDLERQINERAHEFDALKAGEGGRIPAFTDKGTSGALRDMHAKITDLHQKIVDGEHALAQMEKRGIADHFDATGQKLSRRQFGTKIPGYAKQKRALAAWNKELDEVGAAYADALEGLGSGATRDQIVQSLDMNVHPGEDPRVLRAQRKSYAEERAARKARMESPQWKYDALAQRRETLRRNLDELTQNSDLPPEEWHKIPGVKQINKRLEAIQAEQRELLAAGASAETPYRIPEANLVRRATPEPIHPDAIVEKPKGPLSFTVTDDTGKTFSLHFRSENEARNAVARGRARDILVKNQGEAAALDRELPSLSQALGRAARKEDVQQVFQDYVNQGNRHFFTDEASMSGVENALGTRVHASLDHVDPSFLEGSRPATTVEEMVVRQHRKSIEDGIADYIHTLGVDPADEVLGKIWDAQEKGGHPASWAWKHIKQYVDDVYRRTTVYPTVILSHVGAAVAGDAEAVRALQAWMTADSQSLYISDLLGFKTDAQIAFERLNGNALELGTAVEDMLTTPDRMALPAGSSVPRVEGGPVVPSQGLPWSMPAGPQPVMPEPAAPLVAAPEPAAPLVAAPEPAAALPEGSYSMRGGSTDAYAFRGADRDFVKLDKFDEEQARRVHMAESAGMPPEMVDEIRREATDASMWARVATDPTVDPSVRVAAAYHASASNSAANAASVGGKPRTVIFGSMGADAKFKFASEIRKALTDGLAYEISRGIATPAEAVEHLQWIEPALKSGKFFRTYDKVVNYIKRWNIGTPGSVQRNLIGGVFNNMAYGRGVEAESYAWAIKNLFGDSTRLSAEDAALRDAIETVIGKGQYGTEVQARGDWINGIPNSKKFNPLSSKNIGLTAVSDAQELVERLLRGALAHQVLKDFGGVEAPLALERANEWVSKLHVNYDDLATGERQIRRVIPFYTWVSRNVPLQIENMIKHPHLFSRYRATQDAFNRTYDGRSPDKVVPDYFKGLGAFSIPGTNVGGGRLYAAQNMPFAEIMDFASNPSLGGLFEAGLSRATPLVKTPLELSFGKQAFKGLPLRDDVVTPAGPKGVSDWVGRALSYLPGNLAQQGASGQWYTSEKVAYALDQYLPALAQARRVMPQSVNKSGMSASQQKKVKDYSDRQMSSLISYLLGVGVRTNTTDEQNAQLALWDSQNKRNKSANKRLNELQKRL